MSTNLMIPKNEIEEILSGIGYFELKFNYYCQETKTIWYEGYLNTEYLICIKVIDQNNLEIWDCDYYIEQFVKAGIAIKQKNSWKVLLY